MATVKLDVEEQLDYDEARDAEYEQGADPEYDEGSQSEFADDFADSSGEEASQEYQPRKQK